MVNTRNFLRYVASMRTFRFLVIFIFFSSACMANTSISEDLGRLRRFSYELFLALSKSNGDELLPSSWGDVDLLSGMEYDSPDSVWKTVQMVNAFVLLPGAPVIPRELIVEREYSGCRVFAISRFEIIDKVYGRGRYAIVTNRLKENQSIESLYPIFVTEASAQTLIGMLQGFDLESAPRPFKRDDLRRFKEAATKDIDKALVEERYYNASKDVASVHGCDSKIRGLGWVGVLSVLISFLLGLMVFFRN